MISLLMERYPEIGFLLTYNPYVPFEVFVGGDGQLNARRASQVLHAENVREEMEAWSSRIAWEEIEVLYIYGLGLGHYYEPIRSWLNGLRTRSAIFIEEDLGVIDAFLKREDAAELIQHPQVHLRVLAHPKQWKELLEELAQTFPSDRIACTALASYPQSRLKKMRLELMRNSAAIHALLSDVLHGHKIFANLLPNFRRFPEAFYVNKWEGDFAGVPAIICGAGPSLGRSIDALKRLEHRALIIAGGSSLAALSRYGVQPHLGMALDPNPDEYLRLRPSQTFETPLLYGNRLLPDVFRTCNGPFGYIRSDTGGPCETYFEQQLGLEGEAIGPDLGREAFSVTTLGVALAYALGCNPIILVGVDLAYTGMHRYAEGVVDANRVTVGQMKKESRVTEQLLRRKDRQGKTVYTLVKWVMESATIGAYAKHHPERLFINATEGGIGFPGIDYRPLEKVVEEHCLTQRDLRGKIHCLIQRERLSGISSARIDELSTSLKASLGRCLQIADEMLVEIGRVESDPNLPLQTGRMVILELDFEEEMAFECLLQTLGPVLDRVINRYFHFSQERKALIDKQKAKWEHFKTVIRSNFEFISVYIP